MKNKIKNIAIFVLIVLASVTIVGSIYYYKEYPKQDFDAVIFTMFEGVENTSPDVINGIILSCIVPLFILVLVLILPIIKNTRNQIYINIKTKKKSLSFQLFPIKLTSNHRIIYISIIIIISFITFIRCFRIDEYTISRLQETKIFDKYYVDTQNTKITFPEEKRNLIIIIGESFENTVLSKENGGAWEYSLMPELEKLALNNTNFSNSDSIGGAVQTYGASYSAAGNIAITSGTPLKLQDFFSDVNTYIGDGIYLSGIHSIGEILANEGYNLEIIMGSDGNFGGRTQYYTTNGNYKIFDVNYAIEQGKMNEKDKVWWGFDDDTLYKWSKEEITNLSKEDKPFNFIMLTADTHFTDGYLNPDAEIKYDSQYENVHAHSSKKVNEFVEWVKKQSFYKNTTIVIVGDHLGMQNSFYEDKTDDYYERTIYNVFINSVQKATNTKNRQFCLMDMFPTILASIGGKIEGDRLGFGTNLYSETPTLIEELGFDYFNTEIKKTSSFYNKNILGKDYNAIKNRKDSEGD